MPRQRDRKDALGRTGPEGAPTADPTQNGLPHSVHLTELAIAQLPPRRDGPYVFGQPKFKGDKYFTGWTLPQKILNFATGPLPYGPWRIHDLRHTLSTQMRMK